MSQEVKISAKTLIPIGATVIVAAAAMSYGILFQKVEALNQRMARVENKIDQLMTIKLSESQLWTPATLVP